MTGASSGDPRPESLPAVLTAPRVALPVALVPRPVPVVLIGGPARRALAGETRWRVLAVFRRSFYCRDASGSVVCLGPRGLGAGPLNALGVLPSALDWEASGLLPGAGVEANGATLRVDGRFVFELGGAALWHPAPLPGARHSADFARGVAVLAAAAGERAPAEGLGRLIAPLATGVSARRPRPADPPLLSLAWRGIVPLLDWLEAGLAAASGAGAPSPPPAEAASLVGLGPGLTPAGDDFVAGILLALHAVDRADLARALAGWALPVARERTTVISRAHLACAAAGEGAAALHDTLAAVSSADRPRLATCLDAVDAIGHTSGWDALAGIAAVTGACLRRRG
jgi:hypothetical protein